MRVASCFFVYVIAFTAPGIRADEVPAALVEGEQVEAATELVFTEGPAYHADGSVFFTDIANNRIMRLNAGAADADMFLRPSGGANGLMFDRDGNLIACEGNERGGLGGRRIVRINVNTKERTIVADRFEGKRFNSPNDLCIDNKGRIYFTDPYYKALGRIPVPEDMVTNCCFGGLDLKTLYVTAGKTLGKIQCKVPGRVNWPRP